MPFERSIPTVIGAPTTGGDIAKEHRARVASALEENQRKRKLEAAEQVAVDNSPSVRIRAWERIHELRLPMDPTHALVRLIARTTNLTVADIHEEQRRRLALGQQASPTAKELSWNSAPIR